MVVDKNGIGIISGQKVLAHYDDGTRHGIVVKPFPDNPTINSPGHWVDISIENAGPEGVPSYILEVYEILRSPQAEEK